MFPEIIDLPDGFEPEGIASGLGNILYAGSLANGAIWRGDARTGQGSVFIPGKQGRIAVGIDVDHQNRLWVSGGTTGAAHVYDARTGKELASYRLAEPDAGFINDVIVTEDAAYFTDSNKPVLHVVPLKRGGKLPASAKSLPLTGDITYQEGFNANGIETTPDGKRLLVAQSNTGELFSVDPATGVATKVDLGGKSLTSADGLLREGLTLYVVRYLDDQVAVVRLNPNALSGTVTNSISDPNFAVPTTIARSGPFLYTVNSRIGTEKTPETKYQIVRLPRQ